MPNYSNPGPPPAVPHRSPHSIVSGSNADTGVSEAQIHIFDNSMSGDPYITPTIGALKRPPTKGFMPDQNDRILVKPPSSADSIKAVPHRATGAHSTLLAMGVPYIESKG